ncbi:MAG: hypothetical protein FJ280_09155 [Planctomycetes bacterium]|nr:hypothetical protein [Planctomycetota bacterium]
MSERRYAWDYIFIETKLFARDYGMVSESERERLDFDLMQGKGEQIPGTGGLKRIRCGPAGYLGRSQEGWEVVFAEYTYADIQKRLFWLLFKFPLTLDTALTEQDKEALRRLKARADYCMGLYYERLQEGESNG